MSNREEQITFLTRNKIQMGVEGLTTVPAIGTGVYIADTFWRVADVFFNAEGDQGPLPYGWIVMIDLTKSGDNPLYDFEPTYYGL